MSKLSNKVQFKRRNLDYHRYFYVEFSSYEQVDEDYANMMKED